MSWKDRCHISICSFLNGFLPQVHGYWEWLMCDIGLQNSHHNLVFDFYMCVELYDLCANYKIYKLRATWLMSYFVKN